MIVSFCVTFQIEEPVYSQYRDALSHTVIGYIIYNLITLSTNILIVIRTIAPITHLRA